MYRGSLDDRHERDAAAHSSMRDDACAAEKSDVPRVIRRGAELADARPSKRGTPRHSLIVLLPENHVVSPDMLTASLRPRGGEQIIDVLVACAGQPTNLSALQRSIGAAQFLLAPAGTSIEDLRELAIRETSGDIVRLVSGARLDDSHLAEQEQFMTS